MNEPKYNPTVEGSDGGRGGEWWTQLSTGRIEGFKYSSESVNVELRSWQRILQKPVGHISKHNTD